MAGFWDKFRKRHWQSQANAKTQAHDQPMAEGALRAALTRQCQPFTVGGFRPTNDPKASVFGGVRLAPKDAPWPESAGSPMLPLLQLNLSEPRLVPDALEGIALLQVFITHDLPSLSDKVTVENHADPAGAPFAIRAFDTLDGLVPVETPSLPMPLKPFEIAWNDPLDDFANHDVAPVDTRVNKIYDFDWHRSVYTSKLGGWPATVQSEPWWDYQKTEHDFEYALQIGGEEKSGWMWEFLALARAKDAPDLWAMDMQFS